MKRSLSFTHLSRLAVAVCLLLLPLFSAKAAANEAPAASNRSPYALIYHLPLHVHLDHSGRPLREFSTVFNEINHIWLTQAGISFDIKVVRGQQRSSNCLDMYFSPDIGKLNGYYDGEVIQMRDHPRLRPALQPAFSAAGRTAAHELGHALGLRHRQNSDDNLMRSETLGWQLNAYEIKTAREGARLFLLDSST